MQTNHPTRSAQGSVTAGLAAVRAEAALNSPVRFPGEDGGQTLVEMAQRDLDAALQLLADRAQFITGATGAAIALRCDGKKDMLCRASAGSNAPELGALLSTEFGLSGESVRTRQLLRCDDAARDARVNQEACRQLGIASVVVMPVVNDDEVLGVFELFSGRANAFDDRDLSAVQRLTEMVETAVRLANASLSLPKQLEQVSQPLEVPGSLEQKSAAEKVEKVKVVETSSGEDLDEDILLDLLETPAAMPQKAIAVPATQGSSPALSAASVSLDPDADEIIETTPAPAAPWKDMSAKPAEVAAEKAPDLKAGEAVAGKAAGENSAAETEATETAPAETEEAKKPLLWSAANAAVEAEKTSGVDSSQADQNHVPPVLRGLRKCEACGFPISGGRTLCVECEEKKWRGQLKKPQAPTATPTIEDGGLKKSEGQASVAVARGSASISAPVWGSVSAELAAKPTQVSEEKMVAPEAMQTATLPEHPAGELVLSAGLEPSQSWLARNKYIVGVVLAVAAAVTVIFLIR